MKLKMIAFLTMCAMLITLLAPLAVGAEGTVSESTQVNILNQLKLLQGNGQDYNLEGSLKRSEAVAFIVRVLNKEEDVLASKSTYAKTTFSDVKANDWFAAYVGYCVQQNIVDGFPDKTFKPNELVSEKAFLKMLLGAIGHKVNEDFTWDTVYSYAAQINLVDSNYATLTKDNLQYKRVGAITAIYASLLLKNKQTQQTLLDLLDPTHVLAPELAPTPTPTPTPAPDTLVSAVKSVQAVNGSKVTIQFNETIQKLKLTDITLYASGDTSNKLAVTIESQSENDLVLNTDVQKENQDYVVEIANVLDMDNHVTALLSSNFKGYIIPVIKSDLFKISKIETVNKYMLNVYFTQPINSNITLPQDYEILKDGISFVKGSYNNLSVKTISGANNVISILLKNDLISGAGTYTLKISGDVSSVYSAKLNDGNGDSAQFSPNAAAVEDFNVVNLVPLDDKTIEVTFNKELDFNSATQQSNYTIKGSDGVPRGVIKAIVSGIGELKNKTVLLRVAGTFDKSLNYDVTLNNIKDSNNQYNLVDSKNGFTAKNIPTHTDLVIVNVSSDDKGTLTVYFDRKLDGFSAINTGYYNILGVSDPSYSASVVSVYFNPEEPYKVKLFLNSGQQLVSGASYKLQVQSFMMDELGDFSAANSEKSFSGTSNESVKPMIYDAMIIGNDTIRFRTNKEVATSGTNTYTGNYTLEYKVGDTTTTKTINSVSMIDPQTGIIKVDGLDTSKNYKLKLISLTDYSNQYTRSSSDSYSTISVSVGR
ncbi:MAG: S-layer homology domain-containing protein [Paenibacillaceae bacterium]